MTDDHFSIQIDAFLYHGSETETEDQDTRTWTFVTVIVSI